MLDTTNTEPRRPAVWSRETMPQRDLKALRRRKVRGLKTALDALGLALREFCIDKNVEYCRLCVRGGRLHGTDVHDREPLDPSTLQRLEELFWPVALVLSSGIGCDDFDIMGAAQGSRSRPWIALCLFPSAETQAQVCERTPQSVTEIIGDMAIAISDIYPESAVPHSALQTLLETPGCIGRAMIGIDVWLEGGQRDWIFKERESEACPFDVRDAQMIEDVWRGDLPPATLIVREGRSGLQPEVVAFFREGALSMAQVAYVGSGYLDIRIVKGLVTSGVVLHKETIEAIYALQLRAQAIWGEIQRCKDSDFVAGRSGHRPDPFRQLYGTHGA